MKYDELPARGTGLDDGDWIGHPDGAESDEEKRLVAHRKDLVVYGLVADAEADYSYHDYALVSLGAEFYLLETSGCSCPSPTETWSITFGPLSLDRLVEEFESDLASRANWTMPQRQLAEFRATFETARTYTDRLTPLA